MACGPKWTAPTEPTGAEGGLGSGRSLDRQGLVGDAEGEHLAHSGPCYSSEMAEIEGGAGLV